MKLRNKIALGTLVTLAVLLVALALVLSHNSACEPAPAGSGGYPGAGHSWIRQDLPR